MMLSEYEGGRGGDTAHAGEGTANEMILRKDEGEAGKCRKRMAHDVVRFSEMYDKVKDGRADKRARAPKRRESI